MVFISIMNNIQEERLIAAVMGWASAEWALFKGMQYAKDRHAFGRAIGKFQVIRHKLAQMAIKTEACKSMAYRAVYQYLDQRGRLKLLAWQRLLCPSNAKM